MGLVQQEPVLFNLSIRENIAYGDNTRQLKQEHIEQAARMANIHELIISLPQVHFSLSLHLNVKYRFLSL
jgi:ATP-binding cassette, subfamily B (MDR/TAP), member 1